MDDEFEAMVKDQTPNQEWRNNNVAQDSIVTPPIKHTKTQKAIAIVAVSTAALVAIVVAPLFSTLAMSYFACKTLYKWVEYRPFYNDTLTNGSREKFGRVIGQDYTRWDGKAVSQVKSLTLDQKQHELADAYVHGAKDRFFMKNYDKEALDNSFSTNEDLLWLNQEFTRREKKELLDKDLRMLRAFSKALVPLIGPFWVLGTEMSFGGAFQIGCSVCMMGQRALKDPSWSRKAHWGWKQAITFHRNNILREMVKGSPPICIRET